MLHCKLLRSKIAHARIVSIDVSKALAAPGVVAIATGKDLPIAVRHPAGLARTSTRSAPTSVRFVGDPVAAVAAVDEDAAFDALDLIEVEYEPLPPIGSIDEAPGDGPDAASTTTATPATSTSSSRWSSATWRRASRDADRVREDLFFYEGNTHLPMEQHAAVADFGPDGKLTLWSSTQTPHYVHRALAKVLGMPPAQHPRDRDCPTAAASAARAIPSTTRSSSRSSRASRAVRSRSA